MTTVRIDIRRKTFPSPRGEHLVIRDLRLEIQDGRFVCLVGPSGCGKTTLLNILAGLDRHFEGEIHIGQPGRIPRIGCVFQNPRLLLWRTVRQNIELALPEDADLALVEHLLRVTGLEAAQHQYPQKLSLGMSRRVALVRAFAIRPDLLLMDEPFVSLDAPTARRVRKLLIDIWQERASTVLFVTHDLREAMALADRLVFLSAHPMTALAEIDLATPRAQRMAAGWLEDCRLSLERDHPAIRPLL
jgi:NitT/TauT family transport system ATP-binding protein